MKNYEGALLKLHDDGETILAWFDIMNHWVVTDDVTIEQYNSSPAASDSFKLLKNLDPDVTEVVGYSGIPTVEEQLDAIWMELNYRRLNGETLTQNADDMLGKILKEKDKRRKRND